MAAENIEAGWDEATAILRALRDADWDGWMQKKNSADLPLDELEWAGTASWNKLVDETLDVLGTPEGFLATALETLLRIPAQLGFELFKDFFFEEAK